MNKKFLTGQAVILAAGKGVRFNPLTRTRPKPFLKIADKTVLEHNLDQLNNLIGEVILVVGYKGETIKSALGSQYKNIKIKYVLQEVQQGTGDAAKKALPFLKDRFLLLNGDDIYDKEDIRKCLAKYPCMLLAEAKDASNFGAVALRKHLVAGIIEKPKESAGHLINTGLYFLPRTVFNPKIEKSARGEYEFTDYINKFAKNEELHWVASRHWYPLSYPWNLLDVSGFLLGRAKVVSKKKSGKIYQIKGKVIIEKGATIKGGSCLEGPIYIGKGSVVGPNCFIKGPVSIGSDCEIGQAVEI